MTAELPAGGMRVVEHALALRHPDGAERTAVAVSVVVTEGLAPAEPPSWLPLSDDDRSRLARFRREGDARRFVTGRMLVHSYVRDVLGLPAGAVRFARWTTDAGEWKPHLFAAEVGAAPLPDVSLSHSGDRVVAAFCELEVGVDLEQHSAFDGPDDPLLAHALTATERQRVHSTSGAAAAFTRKEAVVKAVGFGLAIDPLHVEILDDRVTWIAPASVRPVSVAPVPMPPDWSAAVAVAGGMRLVPRQRRLDPDGAVDLSPSRRSS